MICASTKFDALLLEVTLQSDGLCEIRHWGRNNLWCRNLLLFVANCHVSHRVQMITLGQHTPFQKQRKSKSSRYLCWETITLGNLMKEDLLCIQNPIKVQTLCTMDRECPEGVFVESTAVSVCPALALSACYTFFGRRDFDITEIDIDGRLTLPLTAA